MLAPPLALALALAPPLVLVLVLAPPLVLVLVLVLVLAEPMLSRPQPRRRMPPRGRAGHGLRTPASRTDTVCLRSRSGEEQ
jgi:hypothetical protein